MGSSFSEWWQSAGAIASGICSVLKSALSFFKNFKLPRVSIGVPKRERDRAHKIQNDAAEYQAILALLAGLQKLEQEKEVHDANMVDRKLDHAHKATTVEADIAALRKTHGLADANFALAARRFEEALEKRLESMGKMNVVLQERMALLSKLKEMGYEVPPELLLEPPANGGPIIDGAVSHHQDGSAPSNDTSAAGRRPAKPRRS